MRVFNIPAVTWALTAVLLLAGSYHLLQAARPARPAQRVNESLHALMNILMAAMLWNLAPSTLLAQIGLLAGAALWFIIQAAARPEFKILCAGRAGRLKCVYHALSMAGAAIMVAMMAHVSPAGAVPAAGMSMAHAHHAMSAAPRPAAALEPSPALPILLTALFAAAALTYLILLLRHRPATAAPHHRTTATRSVRTGHGLEALGAAVMALMFATMTT